MSAPGSAGTFDGGPPGSAVSFTSMYSTTSAAPPYTHFAPSDLRAVGSAPVLPMTTTSPHRDESSKPSGTTTRTTKRRPRADDDPYVKRTALVLLLSLQLLPRPRHY